MLLKQLFLGFIGLCAGGIIAAGVFAFLAIIGVFPRLIGKTKTRGHIMLYETLIILGGAVGNVLDIYEFPLASAGARLLAQKGAGQSLRQASGGIGWLWRVSDWQQAYSWAVSSCPWRRRPRLFRL